MDAPSMVQREGDKLIVRRVVSGDEVFLNQQSSSVSPSPASKDHSQQSVQASQSLADSLKLLSGEEDLSRFGLILEDSASKGGTSEPGDSAEQQLPQCKIKRNYSCSSCTYFTQNPRKYLTHLRDVHGEKIIINECKRCLYASRHYQKLVRHMKMVHGSTDGIKTPFSSRRRPTFRKEFIKKKYSMNTNPTASDLYNQTSAEYINQLMKSGLSKMFESAGGGGGEGTHENSIYFPANFKHGLTLSPTDPTAQQLSQLKGSSNINIFTDNGNTSSLGGAGDSSSQVNNDVLAMLQHNLVDKSQQLTITPALSNSGGSGDVMVKPKRKVRPIPDLIPLHSIGRLHLSGEIGKTYHLNPEVTIKSRVMVPTDSDNNNTVDAGTSTKSPFIIDDESPINLTADQNGDKSLQHQCIFCQIMVRTTDDLALHLRTFHSEELFALLLQKKPEDSGQPEMQVYTAESLTIDIWKRLLENNKAILDEQEARENESDMQSGQFSNDEDDAETVESAISKNDTYCGIETAPGYGEVTKKIVIEENTNQSCIMKKVFKCPHCSFWASTASRFHVHIVGHLNKKPFECSLCSYRSNWRWDITKHIRLKTIRDPSHKTAGVLMNDETGRRNYTKYNRYITLMKVTDNNYKESSSSSKSLIDTSQADYLAMCKSGESPTSLNSLAKMYSSEELAQAFNLANMNQMVRFEPEMLQSLMGMPKGLPAEDAKQSPQKVTFKCRKCNFKNPFRELVLLHVKSTHLNVDKSTSEAEIDLLTCEESESGEPVENATANSTLTAPSPLRTPSSPLSVVSPRNDSGNIGNLTGASTSSATTTTPSAASGGSTGGFHSNNYTTNATFIGVGLNYSQTVANDNRLGTTYTISNTIPSVVFGGEVDRTIHTATSATTKTTTTICASSASASTSTSNTTTTPHTASTTSTTTTTTTGGKGASNTWRPSAPYRCGHCHQVSNWKHVIQRHCRLKHNGNVLIEMVNATKPSQNVTDTRNLKKVRKPFQSFDSVSQDIPVQPVTLHPIAIVPEVSLIVQEVPIIQPPPLIFSTAAANNNDFISSTVTVTPASTPTPTVPLTFINLTEESSLEPPPQNLPTPMQTDSAPTSDAPDEHEEPTPPPAPRTKRYQCEACPYVTNSRTQFAYHKSFHKPRGDPYKCNICSYNVTKKHLLIQHQKTHSDKNVSTVATTSAINSVGNGELSLVMGNKTKSSGLTPAEILDLTNLMRAEVSITPTRNRTNDRKKLDTKRKTVFYCTNCPARYLDESEIVIHQNRHTLKEKYQCDLCSFSTCDESTISTHRNVHSMNYDNGTAELRKLHSESDRHPQPNMIQVGEQEKAWVVEKDYNAIKSTPAAETEPIKTRPRRSTRAKKSTTSEPPVTEITKEPKKYSCEHCDYTDRSENSFKEHMQKHFADILFPKAKKFMKLCEPGESLKLIATAGNNPEDTFELTYDTDDSVPSDDSTDKIIIEI
ncbi:uncharacterized protein LOC131686168 [Topomyia yanbarensis]|uniref:uncharacterized protein LOC131686168 n=1 Tax=Topomyia yanbarensis TaxID=2498891 RepID=UPI00273ADC4C|nr:uncharacterized protein LOC131686168 [Topomyia yanbarensis]XP_058826353.1 uncharacterized protein LOC131686168 [Topomyia yanbarensis]XP_058826354.1 uncharacterized protein LOC131686168 [Topomyia yanbarensis]XP_058826355.1 uncharacterized protein LOC131686168 [Topomyia yanbarensis]XP_058826356.1 uncharacterized protein LOC131686168 [Topomyia yanbarensis]